MLQVANVILILKREHAQGNTKTKNNIDTASQTATTDNWPKLLECHPVAEQAHPGPGRHRHQHHPCHRHRESPRQHHTHDSLPLSLSDPPSGLPVTHEASCLGPCERLTTVQATKDDQSGSATHNVSAATAQCLSSNRCRTSGRVRVMTSVRLSPEQRLSACPSRHPCQLQHTTCRRSPPQCIVGPSRLHTASVQRTLGTNQLWELSNIRENHPRFKRYPLLSVLEPLSHGKRE